jgi:hypothetical protein
LTCTCSCESICTMNKRQESVAEVERWLNEQLGGLWPLALGSLTFRKSPCVREHCRACESGEQHSSYVFLARESGGKRRSLYVPAELAPKIERALENGRLVQELMYEAGARYVKALRGERKARSGR